VTKVVVVGAVVPASLRALRALRTLWRRGGVLSRLPVFVVVRSHAEEGAESVPSEVRDRASDLLRLGAAGARKHPLDVVTARCVVKARGHREGVPGVLGKLDDAQPVTGQDGPNHREDVRDVCVPVRLVPVGVR
jgi:hypothetical protein